MNDPALLHGSYDEAEQAAAFQEALDAWRRGKASDGVGQSGSQSARGAGRGQENGGTSADSERSQRGHGVPYSPVQTPSRCKLLYTCVV